MTTVGQFFDSAMISSTIDATFSLWGNISLLYATQNRMYTTNKTSDDDDDESDVQLDDHDGKDDYDDSDHL